MKKHREPILVTRSSLPPLEEYVEMLKPIWDSAWLTNMGQYHEQLKAELKEYMGVSSLELFVNGHMALELVLQAMSLSGEVITTPFTFSSTTHAIVRNGLTPVFCDINEQDYTIDTDRLESLITDRTTAIVPVHVYGNICNVERIQEIAQTYNLKVIYDAAHTFGETYDGKGVGSFGDASMFSFHATKVFNSIEGGAVTFKDPRLADLLYQLKNFGITGPETVEYVGANAKMNEFQAAMGLCNLRHLESEIDKRRLVAKRYRERLSGVDGIWLCQEDSRLKSNYAYMPVRFDGYKRNREEVYSALLRQGIHARKYFYPCVNAYQCYADIYKEDDTPVARKVSQEILTLPIYAGLSLEIVDEICDVILEI